MKGAAMTIEMEELLPVMAEYGKWYVFIKSFSHLDDHSKRFTVQFIAIQPFTHKLI